VQRGTLTTYLGTAPGVGKTSRMLVEGQRRAGDGEHVVVGWIERHGRPDTDRRLGDLEIVPPRTVGYRGTTFAEFDPAAAIATGADVVLVDELAHSAADSIRQRWEDVAEILDAGLDVLTTTNVAQLRSVRDFAARVTGVGTVASVPDEFVRAGEVVLVDLPADLLRRRIASGAVYSADQVGGALGNYFRAANLTALSALAQAWMAGTVEAVGTDILAHRGSSEPLVAPVVVAGDSGSRRGERVIARAAGLARERDAELIVVHVQVTDGLAHSQRDLDRHRRLTVELGGAYLDAQGTGPAAALADIARARDATLVVVARDRSRLREFARGSVSARLHRLLPSTTIEEVRKSRTGKPLNDDA
jgi:two-component system, OmpR family, sensor histidine kinase KdpD